MLWRQSSRRGRPDAGARGMSDAIIGIVFRRRGGVPVAAIPDADRVGGALPVVPASGLPRRSPA